jgi:hypothetical protein
MGSGSEVKSAMKSPALLRLDDDDFVKLNDGDDGMSISLIVFKKNRQ